MAIPSIPESGYLCQNVECNNIQDQGCEYITKGKWPRLQHINLGIFYSKKREKSTRMEGLQVHHPSQLDQIASSQTKYDINYQDFNEIGPKGCKYLSKGKWKLLVTLYISKK